MPQATLCPPLTIPDVAARLGVSKSTVHRLVHSGALPHLKIGRLVRVQPADVEAFLEASRVDARVS